MILKKSIIQMNILLSDFSDVAAPLTRLTRVNVLQDCHPILETSLFSVFA